MAVTLLKNWRRIGKLVCEAAQANCWGKKSLAGMDLELTFRPGCLLARACLLLVQVQVQVQVAAAERRYALTGLDR